MEHQNLTKLRLNLTNSFTNCLPAFFLKKCFDGRLATILKVTPRK